jgi:hypothetical protein
MLAGTSLKFFSRTVEFIRPCKESCTGVLDRLCLPGPGNKQDFQDPAKAGPKLVVAFVHRIKIEFWV